MSKFKTGTDHPGEVRHQGRQRRHRAADGEPDVQLRADWRVLRRRRTGHHRPRVSGVHAADLHAQRRALPVQLEHQRCGRWSLSHLRQTERRHDTVRRHLPLEVSSKEVRNREGSARALPSRTFSYSSAEMHPRLRPPRGLTRKAVSRDRALGPTTKWGCSRAGPGPDPGLEPDLQELLGCAARLESQRLSDPGRLFSFLGRFRCRRRTPRAARPTLRNTNGFRRRARFTGPFVLTVTGRGRPEHRSCRGVFYASGPRSGCTLPCDVRGGVRRGSASRAP